jgi:hypothetical protein
MPSVIECKQIDQEFTSDLKGKNSASITWRIHTDGRMNAWDALQQALTSTDDPVLPVGAYISNGCYVLRTPIKLEHKGNKTVWIATAECGPWPSDTGTTPGDTAPIDGIYNHPLYRKVIWWGERMTEQEAVERDYQDIPILNSADKPYDVPVFRERYMTVLVAQKNFASYEDIVDLNDDFDNTCNSDTFRGRDPRTVRFLGADISQPQYENGIEFYTATMRFGVKKEQWYIPLVNRGWGFYNMPKSNPTAKYITGGDDISQPISEPVLLDLDGMKVTDAASASQTLWLIYTPVSYATIAADPTPP